MVGEIAELGRADESKVGGIEHEHGPFSLEVLVGHLHELALVVGGRRERLDFGIDHRHENSPWELHSEALGSMMPPVSRLVKLINQIHLIDSLYQLWMRGR